MNKIIAVVGMPGSGKTEVTMFFESHEFKRIYFGGIIVDHVTAEGREVNEDNERYMREHLREVYGMEAMAKLSKPKIDEFLKNGNVVIDGLYSMEEYLFLKENYGDKLIIINIHAQQKIRIERLTKRKERPLISDVVKERDVAQIQNLHTGGPIALADYVIINESSLEDLYRDLDKLMKKIGD